MSNDRSNERVTIHSTVYFRRCSMEIAKILATISFENARKKMTQCGTVRKLQTFDVQYRDYMGTVKKSDETALYNLR